MENKNAILEAESDAVLRCVDCTEEHLCIIHCAACLSQGYVGNNQPCERQLEEDKLKAEEEAEEEAFEAELLEAELILINNEKRELLELGIKGCSECLIELDEEDK